MGDEKAGPFIVNGNALGAKWFLQLHVRSACDPVFWFL